MKRWIAGLFFALMMCAAAPAFAAMPIKQGGNFGIGLGVGTTAAPISLKYFLDSSLSLQGNVGWWRGWGWGGCGRYRSRYRDYYCGGYYNDAFGVGVDVLFEGGPLAGNESVTLDWEIGGGAGVGIAGYGVGFGVAFVAGLQLNIHAIPIDLVLEYRPALYVPGVFFNWLDFTGHIRYYF